MAARYPGYPGTQSRGSGGDRSAEGKVDHELMIVDVLQNDKAEKLQQMLNEQKITTTTRDESGRFLLHKACEYCCPQCILLLLANGAHTTVKVYDVAGYAPIHIAVWKNVEENVKSLIQHDETLVHYPTAYGETPIMIGGLHGCLEVVKYLQSCGASLKHRADSNNTLVHYTASSRCPRTLEYVLQQNGMKDFINTPNKQGDTAAHNAMRSGCSECVRVLLNYGADFDIRNKLSQSPIDIAESLGNRRCLNAYSGSHTAAGAASAEGGPQIKTSRPAPYRVKDWCIPRDPKDKQRSYSFPSLSNDRKTEFHSPDPTSVTATLLQGGDMSTLSHNGQGTDESETDESETDGVTFTGSTSNGIHPQRNGEHSSVSSKVLLQPSGGDKDVALPLTQAMKQKPRPLATSEKSDPVDDTAAEEPKKAPHEEKMRNREYRHPQTDPMRKKRTATTGKKGGKNVPTAAGDGTSLAEPASNQTLSQSVGDVTVEESHKCSKCKNVLAKRNIIIEQADVINTGYTSIGSAGRVIVPDWICLACDKPSCLVSSHDETDVQTVSVLHELHIAHASQHSDRNLESGYFSMPRDSSLQSSLPSSGQPYTVTAEMQPEDSEGKIGEDVILRFKAHTNSDHNQLLKYRWYTKKGGKFQTIKDSRAPELRWRIDGKHIQKEVFCRAYLGNEDSNYVQSRTVTVTAKRVWFSEPLTFEGGYYGETAVLKCQAEKAAVMKGQIKYLWLKRVSKKMEFYKATDEGLLTFDPLTPENDGYYICQAQVNTDFRETEEVLVQGKNRPTSIGIPASPGSIQITKQPRSCVVVEGGELQLRCRAELRAGVKGSLHYQWFHHDTAITGATDPTYRRANTQASSTGGYYCKVTGEGGERVSTQQVTVALSHPEEAGEEGGFKSSQQRNQIEARRVLQTSTGKRFAREKVALLIGNQAYEPGSLLCNLTTPENDVRSLTNVLTESGFKVFSLVNLRCHEMMKALKFVCDLLVPGVYVVFAYIGHGCRLQNSDYIIPVDAHHPLNPAQCVASATISERLQSHLGRIFKITNCCRSSALSEDSERTYRCPENQRNHDFANIVEVTSCSEGQQSYEVSGKTCSSFSTALTVALRGEGTYMQVLENVQKEMRECLESVNGSTFAEPKILLSLLMDKEISFHDDVMLDDTQYEDKLDQLENTWKEIHTVPAPVRLTLGPELSRLLLTVELEFDWEFSNVLLVQVKWRVCCNTCSACSVTMSAGGQEVSIERADLPPTEASFRVNSLQRLSASLQLHLTFSATVTDGTTTQHTVTHDLQSRPLYAQVSSS